MKSFPLALFIVLCTALSSFSQTQPFSIIGKWNTLDEKGNLMSYTFKKNGQYEISGKGISQKTNKESVMTYKYDAAQSPDQLDLTITNKKDERMSLTILGIVDVIDNDNIKVNLGGMERPTDFFGKKVSAFQRDSKK
jgi:uncharacterized protein (TIGR03067 family)